MVLGTQSDGCEDSQNRQLRVSKKLSKAISSVPRSRFQKPRPNLPGSKRSESNVPSTRKRNESSENTVTTKADNTKISESSSKSESTITSNKCDVSPNNEIVDKQEILSTNEAAQNNDAPNVAEKLIINEISRDTDTVNSDDVIVIEKSQSFEELKKSLNTDEKTQNIPAEESESLNTLTEETSHSDATVNSTSTNESIQEFSAEKTPTFDAPDSLDAPPVNTPNNTDKSFKYPHLTSILSKKRTEPKKEVQHKKRKKFKKGDAAPERSKMTMADLIYWNPTNNAEPPAKTAVPEYEIPANTNVDDPEESPDADAPVEESSVCESVPKLVIAEDGSINIDQSSLVVSRNIAEPTVTEFVRKDDTTYSSFRKRPMTKHWTAKDTTIFYKALSLVGTDFGLMEKIFPHRTRRELKLKFKREEKFNIELINRAMYESHLTFDANTLCDLINNLGELNTENEKEYAKATGKEKKKPVKRKRKTAKEDPPVEYSASAVVTASVSDDDTEQIISTVRSKRKRKAKKLPDDFDEIEVDILLEAEEAQNTNNNEAVCEPNSTENNSRENLHDTEKTQSSTQSSADSYTNTGVEILCIDDVVSGEFGAGFDGNETILVSEINSKKSRVIPIQKSGSDKEPQTIDKEQEKCITVEYVDISGSENLATLGNVMAFEVVASHAPIPKRRRKINFRPTLPIKDSSNSGPTIKLSSTNYTPL